MKSKLTYTFTFQLVIHVVQKCYDGEQETPWEQLQAFLHICLYALKAWNMFSCLFQTESVENFLLAFLGFSRLIPAKPREPRHSCLSWDFSWIFCTCKQKAGNPGILLQNSPESQAPLAVDKTKKKKKIIILNDAGSVFFLSQ